MSAADALSLHTQTSTTPAHTVALIIMEASDQLSHDRLHRLVASSLPALARFRSRLVGKPLGMGQPVWAEIDDYDPAPQIHGATVHNPGGRSEFADLIGQLAAEPLDRPLWEAWSIDGLAGGQWALAVKMSPAVSGAAGGSALVWPRLLTTRAHDPADTMPTEQSLGTPSLGEVVTDTMTEVLENNVTGAWLLAEAVTDGLRVARSRLRGAREHKPIAPAASSMSGPVPHTVFDAPLTERRAVAFASIPLADLQTVNNAFGGSITNVLLAVCTLSLRAWLQRHDTVPDAPLLMQMPLAPPDADPTAIGNPLTVGRIRLPVQLDDPVLVLTNLHTATERLNTVCECAIEKGYGTVDFVTIASVMPPTVARAASQLYTRLGLAPICHGSVSYLAGKPVPAYCAGAMVVGLHTVAPLQAGCGLTIALTSRGDVLDLSVCVCPDNVPVVDDIATGIAESVDILVAAARESPRGHGRSVVTKITSHATKRSHGRRY
ncbi:wax ester/triacylglycerol synthase domain-containing protein [Mycobacterium sp. 050134]|uniref:wax ester/triacylglycerol synthase domain-containing protein n=1 Tax=Mycobacterium sp. 050134 TaxID=3096111 RepID=UPI002ED9D623